MLIFKQLLTFLKRFEQLTFSQHIFDFQQKKMNCQIMAKKVIVFGAGVIRLGRFQLSFTFYSFYFVTVININFFLEKTGRKLAQKQLLGFSQHETFFRNQIYLLIDKTL
jgi:hypothetical protein